MDYGHPLAAVLVDAAHGRNPVFDGSEQVMPPLDGLAAGVFSFTGHTIIATDLSEEEVVAHVPGGASLGNPMHPSFIAWLAQRLGASCYTPDAVLVAFRPEAGTTSLVERPDLQAHPRTVMAMSYRSRVRTYSDVDGNGLLTVGYGVCGRLEVSVEVEPALRNRGLGRKLAYAARTIAPAREPVFAQVSPGNAASLRAFLAAGYVPIGSEVLMAPAKTSETQGGV